MMNALEHNTTLEPENKDKLEKNQQARAFLRERFLRVISGCLQGNTTTFTLYENNIVKATFACADSKMRHICVKNLETALGTQPNAILRSSDIISFKVDIKN